MSEEFIDVEETEEIDIEDTDSTEGEQPDRGDEVTVPDEETEGVDSPEADEDSAEEGAKKEEDSSEESEETKETPEERKGVPSSRVSQISRQKSALQDISDGLMNDSVDKSVIKDLGGVKAVALAIAKGELQLSEISVVKSGSKDVSSDPSADDLWDKYNIALENLDTNEAKKLLKAARAADKKETSDLVTNAVTDKMKEAETARDAKSDYDKANEFFTSLQDEHPDLKDAESETYLDFIAMTNGLSQRMPYSEAVQHAAKKLLKTESPSIEKENKTTVTTNKRKAAALKKNAEAAQQQPPSLADNTGTKHNKKTLKATALTEDEFDNLSDAEKKRMRGDEL